MEKHLVISVRELGVSDRNNVKMVESAAHAKVRMCTSYLVLSTRSKLCRCRALELCATCRKFHLGIS
jgi:hypothetical protein